MEDAQLYASIFKCHFDALYNYGIKISNDSELVKDCIQELFLKIWKNNIDLAKVSYLKSYLLTGLRRQILNVLELKYYQIDKIKIEDHFLVEFSPEDYFIHHQFEENQRKSVIQALNKLSNKQREAIYLRYFEELEYCEIAEVMKINLQSAKNTVHRGLNALHETLEFFLFFTLFEKILR